MEVGLCTRVDHHQQRAAFRQIAFEERQLRLEERPGRSRDHERVRIGGHLAGGGQQQALQLVGLVSERRRDARISGASVRGLLGRTRRALQIARTRRIRTRSSGNRSS